MQASDTSKLLKLLAEHGEEKIGTAISKLRGLTKSAPKMIEENAGKAQMLPAIYDAAPALEGEVVGDLATQASKRILPDIETQAGKVPLMLQQAEEAAPNIVPNTDDLFNAGKNLVDANPPKSNMLRNIGIGGAGVVGGLALMDGGDSNPPEQKPVQPVVPSKAQETAKESMPDVKSQNEKASAPVSAPVAAPEASVAQPQLPQAPVPQGPSDADQFNQQLEDARQKDQQHQLLFGMLKAAQMGGSAMAGSKADTSYADQELARPNQQVTNLKTAMDMKEEAANIHDKNQKRDPASKVSLLYQATLKQLNPAMNVEGLSAEQVEKAFPQVASAINRQDMIKQRAEDAKQKSLDRQMMFQARKDAALEKVDEKDKAMLIKAQAAMDEQKSSSRTPLGRETMRLNGGIHAQNIINQYRGRENEMPNIVKKELAVAMATMVSPGLPHEKTIEAMDLKTFSGGVGDVVAKVTGVPMGGQAGGFVKFADKMIKGQMNVAQKLIKEEQAKQMTVYKNAFHNPKSYEILNSLYQTPEAITASAEQPTVAQPANKPVVSSGLVTIRSKKTGTTKTLSAESAAKYLNDPSFERVQ